MKKWLLLLAGLVTVGGVVGFFLLTRGPGEVVYADPDCSPDAPIMAIDLYGDLRQDDVAVIYRDGRVERLTDEHASFSANFSPDGEQLVFTSGREGIHEECCGFFDQEIYVMNIDGTDQRRLMEESNDKDWAPAWSPDGSTIAFVRNGRSLMLVGPDGEDPRLLYKADVEIYELEWSPDSERIAFTLDGDLYLIDADGGEAEILAEKIGAQGLAWSPDGETIAFTAGLEVHTLTLEEPNPRLIARDAHTPAWSPDGEFIAYFEEGDDVEDFTYRITTEPAGGGEEKVFDVKKKDIYSFARNLEWLNCTAD